MRIPNEIIEIALGGGWEPDYLRRLWVVNYSMMFRQEVKKQETFRIALDPLFWQALGKALGWNRIGSDIPNLTGDWHWQARRFYDLILQQQPTDSFWANLLSPLTNKEQI